MKKLVSIFLAMLMVMSTMSAFAAVEANAVPAFGYLNDFAGIPDYTATSNAGSNPSIRGNVGLNKDHPVDAVMSGEQFTVKRPATLSTGAENKKTGLAYLYFAPADTTITDDKFAIGFDFKFSGIESNTTNSLISMNFGTLNTGLTDAAMNNVNSGKWFIHTDGLPYAYTKNEDGSIVYDESGNPVPNGSAKASKTGWRFYADGSARPSFSTAKVDGALVLGDNGLPAVYCGTAKLEQDTFYTFKMYLDQNTKTFNCVIIDGNGNILDTGVRGRIQNTCEDVCKLDIQLQAGLNYGTSVTYDNIFYDSLDFVVSAPATVQPNEEGTVSFTATIPDNMVNPAVYINGNFVENITVVPHKTDYLINAVLPAGTALGDLNLEVRGTLDGQAVSASAVTRYVKATEKNVAISYNSTKITGYDNEVPYYGPGDTRTNEFNAITDGLYEIGTTFRRVAGNSSVVFRLKSDVISVNGGAVAIGALFDKTSGDAWTHFDLGGLGIAATDTDWHDFKLLVDFRGNAMTSAQPYSISIDDQVVRTGKFIMDTRSTMNGFIEFGMYNVNYKETYIKELVEVGAKDVTASYVSGESEVYNNEPLLSIGLDKLTFAFNTAFDNASAISFVDAYGDIVDGVTLSIDGENILVTPDENVTIPTGSYKLVIDKNATFGGVKLGANIEVPVELSAPNKILSPENGVTINDNTVEISAFLPDAEKVEIFVNDEAVKTFAAPTANGFYSYEYKLTKIGTNYVDVYYYTASGVKLSSSEFVWEKYGQTHVQGTTFKSDSWSPVSGAKGVTASTNIKNQAGGFALTYTASVTSGDRFFNLTFSSETSGTQRIGVREYEIMLGENTKVYTELGVSRSGAASTSGTNYPNPVDWPGTSGKYLFAANGTIAGSSYKWEAGQWYHVRHVLDMEHKVVEVYITNSKIGENVLVASMDITNNSMVGSYGDTIANYSKYRIHVLPIDGSSEVMPSITISNPLTYQLKLFPVMSVAEKTITAGTDTVAIALNKAFSAIDVSKITIKANGEAIEGATATVSDTNITVTGLAGVKAGSKVTIELPNDAKYYGSPIRNTSIATVFVADSNGVCLLPLKVGTREGGYDLFGYSKYVSSNANDLDTYLIMTEYTDSTNTRVRQTNFAPVTVKAGVTGIVSGYLTGISAAQGCQVMIWNTDFAPIIDAVNGQ